jgi:hypothetical protein
MCAHVHRLESYLPDILARLERQRKGLVPVLIVGSLVVLILFVAIVRAALNARSQHRGSLCFLSNLGIRIGAGCLDPAAVSVDPGPKLAHHPVSCQLPTTPLLRVSLHPQLSLGSLFSMTDPSTSHFLFCLQVATTSKGAGLADLIDTPHRVHDVEDLSTSGAVSGEAEAAVAVAAVAAAAVGRLLRGVSAALGGITQDLSETVSGGRQGAG